MSSDNVCLAQLAIMMLIDSYGTLQFGGSHTPAPAPSVSGQCGAHATEMDKVTIECTATGATIIGFDFVSYGTPSGGCGDGDGPLAVNTSCDSAAARAAVVKACVGKSHCAVSVSNALAGGVDPCHKVHKWLSWNATCSSGKPMPPPSPSPGEKGIITLADFNVTAWRVNMVYVTNRVTDPL